MTHQNQLEDTQDVSVQVPRRSVDPSESLEERLTENVYEEVLPARYLKKDEEGNLVEEPEELFRRVAEDIAKAEDDPEEWADTFQKMMESQRLMLNSPSLMNAGTDVQQMSACFVRNPQDSMESIFETAKESALIQKSGGGVGYDFSRLRCKGEPVASTGGVSSGPVSFMEVFDSTCGTIQQGGKRRGAQMSILRADHADIGRFCASKREEGRFSNFNISVGVTGEFRHAIEDDTEYAFYTAQSDHTEPQIVRTETRHFYSPEYRDAWNDQLDKPGDDEDGNVVEENLWRDYADNLSPEFVEEWGEDDRLDLSVGEEMTLPARFVWDMIVDGAYWNGEPGVFNLEATNRDHSYDVEKHPDMSIRGTNPCSEQPLLNGEACTLGHINLSMITAEDAPMWADYDGSVKSYVQEAVDIPLLRDLSRNGIRFLDDVNTRSEFPLEEISRTVEENRKVGLGIMGLHHMLIQMGFEYGSKESMDAAHEVMNMIRGWAVQESHALALERGTFENWEKSKYANPTENREWFHRHVGHDPDEWKGGFPMRNHNVLTIAPTGTTSMLADTSGGCEPIYNVAYMKNVGDDIQGGDYLVEFDNLFLDTLEENGIDTEEIRAEAEELMMSNEFKGAHSLSIPDEIADLFVTTNEIDGKDHVRMQRGLQAATDSGISKTCNCSNNTTRGEVDEMMRLALSPRKEEYGDPSKGFTVYRDGSRMEQVNTVRADNELDETEDGPSTHGSDSGTDGSNQDTDESVLECPDCGTEIPEREGACPLCPDCGWTEC